MIFVFGDCELDTHRYELRRAGLTCHVEPQVLDLLGHLVNNRDRLVTKDEIHEVIWKGRVVSESALSARISAARRAIGDHGPEGYIRTVFRRGFRFVGPVETRRTAADAARPRPEPRPAPDDHDTFDSPVHLAGHFVCYSHAWSPAFDGKLIRGSLSIEPGSGASASMRAVYSEMLPNGPLRHVGPVTFSDRTLYLDLVDIRSRSRVFLTLLCPSPPATALLGVMSGKVFHDPNAEVAVTRFVAIRVPGSDHAALDGSNRYLDGGDGALSEDLGKAGLAIDGPHVDAALTAFLTGHAAGGFFRVSAADNQAVNVALDRTLARAGQPFPVSADARFKPARAAATRRTSAIAT